MSTTDLDQHFVYLYSDAKNARPVYVGYGAALTRAEQHPGRSHSEPLEAWLAHNPYVIRVSGPYGTKREARAAESALIGALQPKFNTAARNSFRPLGVPAQYVDRFNEPELNLLRLAELCVTGALIVCVTGRADDDGRTPLDFSRPTDTLIRMHAQRWWQLDRHVKEWLRHPGGAPRTLIALSGPPAARYVLAATPIDARGWARALPGLDYRSHGLWRVPLPRGAGLDAHGLRGRRIAGVRFGQHRAGLFKVLSPRT